MARADRRSRRRSAGLTGGPAGRLDERGTPKAGRGQRPDVERSVPAAWGLLGVAAVYGATNVVVQDEVREVPVSHLLAWRRCFVVITPVVAALLLRERLALSTVQAVALAPTVLALLSLRGLSLGSGRPRVRVGDGSVHCRAGVGGDDPLADGPAAGEVQLDVEQALGEPRRAGEAAGVRGDDEAVAVEDELVLAADQVDVGDGRLRLGGAARARTGCRPWPARTASR